MIVRKTKKSQFDVCGNQLPADTRLLWWDEY
jgi:hypothetical protein